MWYTNIKSIQDFCNIKQKQEISSDKNSWTSQADSIKFWLSLICFTALDWS